MNVVYLIEDFSIKGGAERMVSLKANHMARRFGYRVTVVSVYADGRPPGYPLADGVGFVSLGVPAAVKDRGAAARIVTRVGVLLRASARFNRLMADIRPDIIFFTMSLGALLLPLYRGGARRVFESHSARTFTPYSRFFGFMERKADAVVCLTADDAAEYCGAGRVEVIPNFVEGHGRRVADYSVKRAVAVGRLEHVKGFDILIDCWRAVAKAHPDWQLHIYGDGSLRGELQSRITSLGLDGAVRLMGRCDDMMYRYADYSLHIMTSRYEGQPMALIEAQACGLPSVVFNFKYGAKDIVKSGFNGILVPQDDTDTLVRGICRMADDWRLRAKYGANAVTIADKFAPEGIMDKWKRLIEELTR